ncbi:RNA-guided endonuclease TnpB family protein, partial [Pelatocladus sp. BLCC-F211]
MYKTIPVKARFTDEEKVFWIDQCQNANSLINSAIFVTRQSHYEMLKASDNAFTTYWRGDELRHGWKTYRCNTTYPELEKILKDNPHYKAMAAQSAQQTLKSVGESIVGYNGLVKAYYRGEVDKPSLPGYRKSGG